MLTLVQRGYLRIEQVYENRSIRSKLISNVAIGVNVTFNDTVNHKRYTVRSKRVIMQIKM